MRIATLGPEGTFSHEAVLKYKKKSEILFKDTIWDIFESVNMGEVDLGIVPVENSVSGTVGLTLDAIMDFDLNICDEIILPVRHNLVGNGKMEDIKKLYSHPQTHAQCVKFIRNNIKGVEVIPTASNAKSAEELSKMDKPEYGAIVSTLAMREYKLNAISKNIHDNRFNVTRFVVITQKETESTGNDRTSLAIYPHMDKPGLLYDLIGEFAKRKINLTKIESRPSKGRLGDYIFFIDLQGHKDDQIVKDSLSQIEKNFFLKMLGSYPREY
jgi:prephenate dehydratase